MTTATHATRSSSSSTTRQQQQAQQPETPQQQYERALARAQADGLKIVGRAFQIVEDRKRPAFYVPSVTEHGYLHCIVQMPDTLVCDCMAAQRGVYCKHRAVVRHYLAAQGA